MTAITISYICVGGVGLLIARISIPFFAKAINAKKNCVAHASVCRSCIYVAGNTNILFVGVN